MILIIKIIDLDTNEFHLVRGFNLGVFKPLNFQKKPKYKLEKIFYFRLILGFCAVFKVFYGHLWVYQDV